jgi:hypothetical protein
VLPDGVVSRYIFVFPPLEPWYASMM